MGKIVNVKGTANAPIIIGDTLYTRGTSIDVNIERDLWIKIGVSFLEKMLDGYSADFVEQKLETKEVEDAQEEILNPVVDVNADATDNTIETLAKVDTTKIVRPKAKPRTKVTPKSKNK